MESFPTLPFTYSVLWWCCSCLLNGIDGVMVERKADNTPAIEVAAPDRASRDAGNLIEARGSPHLEDVAFQHVLYAP